MMYTFYFISFPFLVTPCIFYVWVLFKTCAANEIAENLEVNQQGLNNHSVLYSIKQLL